MLIPAGSETIELLPLLTFTLRFKTFKKLQKDSKTQIHPLWDNIGSLSLQSSENTDIHHLDVMEIGPFFLHNSKTRCSSFKNLKMQM